MECQTNEVSAKSIVKKFSPDTGENPFAKMNESIVGLITDVINKLQSEASSEADAVDDPFARVKPFNTDLINRLHSEVLPETSHKAYRNDESMRATVDKEDIETRVETHSVKRETAISKTWTVIAELHADLGDWLQQLKMDERQRGKRQRGKQASNSARRESRQERREEEKGRERG